MRITLLFGGTNKERLVSVASAQALHQALPEADLWFWDVDDTVHEAESQALLKHSRPFEEPFRAGTPSVGMIEQALDKAKAEDRLLVLGRHGGSAENGELQAMCEMRGIPFTGSGSASSHLAFDKIAAKSFAAIGGGRCQNMAGSPQNRRGTARATACFSSIRRRTWSPSAAPPKPKNM